MSKKIEILCSKEGNGSSFSSAYPIAPWNAENKAKYDLNKKCLVCFSSDDFRLVETNAYEVHEVEVPDWVSPEWYCRDANYVKIKYLLGFGADIDWSERVHKFLIGCSEGEKLACIRLLKTKKFRSSFRSSLRNQLENWLENESPEYNSPFSNRQWDCLVDRYTALEAKNISRGLYLSR